jgi:hypothetical protein
MSKILYKFRETGYRLLFNISITYLNILIIKQVKTRVTITIKIYKTRMHLNYLSQVLFVLLMIIY